MCKESFPATTEYFFKESRTKCGLRSRCRKCFNEQCNQNVNLEQKRISSRKRVSENKEQYKKLWKSYRRRNKDKIAVQKQEYYLKNKEKLTRSIRIYQDENKEKTLLRNSIFKRIRYTDEQRNYSIDEWNECKAYFNNECAYCGRKAKSLNKEHFIPFKHGGEFSRLNIIPACKSCNSSKYDKSFFEWYKLQKYYSLSRELKILKYLNYDTETNTQQLALI